MSPSSCPPSRLPDREDRLRERWRRAEVSLPHVTIRAEDFVPASRKAMELSRPALSDAPVDDSDDKALGQQVLPRALICEGEAQAQRGLGITL
jgi:hypothetical protein